LTRRFAFARRQRLLKGVEFSAVFAARQNLRSRSYQVQSLPNRLGFPRLGIVVAKRQFGRAVDRNRVRRVIRETFRQQAPEMPSVDIVVRVHSMPVKSEAVKELTGLLKKVKC
jgi:ribonuclease P protein component